MKTRGDQPLQLFALDFLLAAMPAPAQKNPDRGAGRRELDRGERFADDWLEYAQGAENAVQGHRCPSKLPLSYRWAVWSNSESFGVSSRLSTTRLSTARTGNDIRNTAPSFSKLSTVSSAL
jgi:hypothetical protein